METTALGTIDERGPRTGDSSLDSTNVAPRVDALDVSYPTPSSQRVGTKSTLYATLVFAHMQSDKASADIDKRSTKKHRASQSIKVRNSSCKYRSFQYEVHDVPEDKVIDSIQSWAESYKPEAINVLPVRERDDEANLYYRGVFSSIVSCSNS